MDLLTLLLLAVGLSMDAFAVAICKGLAVHRLTWRESSVVGAWFGGFQALMPFLGYVLGRQFETYINRIAPWVAFVLLGLIGLNMLKDAFAKDGEEESSCGLSGKEMFPLAVATSIDALAVGVTFACVPVAVLKGMGGFFNTAAGCLIIGVTTFLWSAAGVKIGNLFGCRYKNRAEAAGGLILLFLGVKILLQGL